LSLPFVLCERAEIGTVGIQKGSEAASGTCRGSGWVVSVDFES